MRIVGRGARIGIALSFAFATGVAAGGCATVEDKDVVFRDAHRRYTQLMRFNEYERAGRFIAPDARADFRSRTDSLGDLRFSDYEIRDVESAGDAATVRVQYTGYRSSSPITVTYVEEQLWERTDGAWILRSLLEEKRP